MHKQVERTFSLAFVTGASSGIGEALAFLLAEKGINLIIHGRNVDNLNRIQRTLADKVNVDLISADLASRSERKRVIEMIHSRKPDLMINNAGFGLYGPALSHEIDEEMEILEVNANAVMELTLEAAKAMTSAGISGVILNVSSSAGELPLVPGFAAYSASKAFVNHFSQSLDRELQPAGIRILSAAPGYVNTNFSKRAGGKKSNVIQNLAMTSDFAGEQIWRQIQKGTPLHLFDWKTRFLVRCSKLFPKKWVAKILHRFNNDRS
jgi:uncharacterized protein